MYSEGKEAQIDRDTRWTDKLTPAFKIFFMPYMTSQIERNTKCM